MVKMMMKRMLKLAKIMMNPLKAGVGKDFDEAYADNGKDYDEAIQMLKLEKIMMKSMLKS